MRSGPFDCAQGPFDWAQGPWITLGRLGSVSLSNRRSMGPSTALRDPGLRSGILSFLRSGILRLGSGALDYAGGFLNAMDYRISTCSPARALFMLRTAQNFPHIEQVSSCSGARLSRIAFAVSGSSAHSH